MYHTIKKCRICGNTELHLVVDLGEQMLTGVFPVVRDARVTSGPLQLVKCAASDETCGLLQLAHTYDAGEMYGDNYGYRSGLNASMVSHLIRKVQKVLGAITLQEDDLVLDIGSNDSTTLQAYAESPALLVGIDPTGAKFRNFYPPHIRLIADFFSAEIVRKHFPGRKAKVITSFSMFYDLDDPMRFMREVHEILADDGLWIFEQSYMPTMLDMNSYDTACHEHLEYYALRQIKWMADRVGFDIVEVEFNDVNGGSFSVTASKRNGAPREAPAVQEILDAERGAGMDTPTPYLAFAARVAQLRQDLLTFIEKAQAECKRVAALGASTKGNVLLQYCGLTQNQIFAVGEVNPEKFGRHTPGSWIPIKTESEVLAEKPDYLLVLPWHFRQFFVGNPKFFGMKLVFPLPVLEIEVAGSKPG